MSFQAICVNPDGGWVYSPTSGNISIDQSATIDLYGHGFVSGANCWVEANIMGGGTHGSGDNFTYNDNGGTAVYQITGTTLNPSWSLIGG